MSSISGPGSAAPLDPAAHTDTGTTTAPAPGGATSTVDRTSGGARLTLSPVGTNVVDGLRVEEGAIGYVEGALAALPAADARTLRRLLDEAAAIDGNKVLSRPEAEKAIEPALRARGAAALAAALRDVDADLDKERAREADLRDGVDLLFNSETRGPSLTQRVLTELDEAVAEAAGRPVDVNIMIFSFTDKSIADKLIAIARDNPNVNVRMIADWAQTSSTNGYKPGVLSREAERLGLTNFEVKFKKDQPYKMNPDTGRPDWDHATSRGLNHHKGFVTLIDGNPRSLVAGSFNWSPTAERSNYENLMVLDASAATNREVMRHYEEEFEAYWNDGRASLTLRETADHKRRVFDELERGVAPGQVVGLPSGAGASIARLAPEDVLDLNGWTQGERIAGLLGGGAAATDVARAMQAERLRYGRFRDWEDLETRVPSVGSLPRAAQDKLRREGIFGDGQVSVSTASVEELMAIGAPRAAAEAIVRHRTSGGDFESLAAVEALPGVSAASFARFSRHLSPEVRRVAVSARRADEAAGDTGYARVNEEKTVPVLGADGVTRRESATLGAGAVDIIRRAKPGETLQLATYGLSSNTPEHAALIEAARRGVKLQVILNRAANEAIAASLKDLASRENLPISLKVSSRTMHQKYLVHVEGEDAFNGSANLSGSSATRHSEDRFSFKNNPAIARAFTTDFTRLWDRLPG